MQTKTLKFKTKDKKFAQDVQYLRSLGGDSSVKFNLDIKENGDISVELSIDDEKCNNRCTTVMKY